MWSAQLDGFSCIFFPFNSLGIFLIPYFVILFVCGMPMLFMELAVGQYTGRGPIGAISQLCPLFKGLFNQNIFLICLNWCNVFDNHSFFFVLLINLSWSDRITGSNNIQHAHSSNNVSGAGLASVIVSFLMSTYYSVIIAYAIYYLFSAFRPEMPWLDCSHRFVDL